MEPIINEQNLRSFAYVNEKICEKPIRGIVVSFFGLGGADMYDEDTEDGKYFAERGLLFFIPYLNPWAWMNRAAVQHADRIIDVLIQSRKLPETIPVIPIGGSMGGQSALVFTAYTKHKPAACVTNCPVCDLPFHYTERPDLPRTLYSAFSGEDGTLEEVLRTASPLHLVEKLPDIPYFLFHCEEDHAVNIHNHSERFVAAMRDAGRDIRFYRVPGRDHCDLTPDMWEAYRAAAAHAVGA